MAQKLAEAEKKRADVERELAELKRHQRDVELAAETSQQALARQQQELNEVLARYRSNLA
jgi:hypothetical protein